MASINLKDGTATGINGEPLFWDGIQWREDNIKGFRQSTGLSQSKFAEYYGISVRNIQEWEQERKNPPPYLLGLMKRIWEAEQ